MKYMADGDDYGGVQSVYRSELRYRWTKLGESEGHSVVSDLLRPHGLYSLWNSPGQNTGVGHLSFLQGILPIQGSNPGLPSHQGSPRILEWVAYSFSSGSSQPRNQTGVSCVAGGFFTSRASREAPKLRRERGYIWD